MLKKILAFALALLVVASMAACSRDGEDDKEKDNDGQQTEQNNPEGNGEQTPPDTTDPDPDQTPEQPPEQTPDVTPPADPEAGMTEVSEEVYATVTVDLRSAPEVSVDNVVGILRYGQRATRTKVSEEWSKITYQESEYFVASNCLALYDASIELPGDDPVVDPVPGDDDPVTPDTSDFVTLDTPETVYVVAESALNLRSAPGMDGEIKLKVGFGVAMERVALNNTWSRVEYNGVTYYAFSEFLTTDDISGEGYTELAAPQTMYVTASSLWIRYYPSMIEAAKVPYTVLEGLHYGDAVQCIAISPDSAWARVLIGGNEYYVGYQHLALVAPDGGETTPEVPVIPGK
ncbi:MAG: hypothetical protein IJW40_07370 [Clostridia bacterium]|nr:hypothetical protein [Clostridia bacterium]